MNAQLDEATTLAYEKSASAWKAMGMMHQGSLSALTGEASNAVQKMTSGISALAVHGINVVVTVVFIKFGESLRGTRPIR